MKKKLLIVDNFEAPYRVPFYKLLANHYDLTLVLSEHPEDQKERNPKWFHQEDRNYKLVYLKPKKIFGIPIGFDVRNILKEQWDVIYMGLYGNPTNIYAVWCLNHLKKRFVLSVDGMLPRNNERLIVRKLKGYLLKSPYKILSSGSSVDKCLMSYGVPKERLVRYHLTTLLDSDILEKIPDKNQKNILRKKLEI